MTCLCLFSWLKHHVKSVWCDVVVTDFVLRFGVIAALKLCDVPNFKRLELKLNLIKRIENITKSFFEFRSISDLPLISHWSQFSKSVFDVDFILIWASGTRWKYNNVLMLHCFRCFKNSESLWIVFLTSLNVIWMLYERQMGCITLEMINLVDYFFFGIF